MHILIIEDDVDIAETLKESLEAASFTVDIAVDGKEGLRQARMLAYDLILLDLHLPGMSGLDIGGRIRARNKKVRIMAVSTETEISSKLDMLAFCDDYVCKPFSLDELKARICAIMRRGDVVYNTIMELDDLRLDITAHKVSRGGREITLRNKEFALLELFMRNIDVLLSRDLILEKVWDMHIDPFTNTVDVHMSYLRKKIDRGFRNTLLHTIPGKGYKLGLRV